MTDHYDKYNEELREASKNEAKERTVELLNKFEFDKVMFMQKVAMNIERYMQFEDFIKFTSRQL